MSPVSLNAIVTKAVVSDRFRAGILNGQRAVLIRDFELEPDEIAAIMSIRVDSLAAFAAAIDEIVQARELAYTPSMRNWNATANHFISR